MRVRTLLVLGILAREAFSFWTGHPFDFELWVRTGYWVSMGHDPYLAIPFAPGVSFSNDFGGPGSEFAAAVGYLPFWPVILGGLYALYALLGSPTPYLYYFMIKQPIILCDILLAYFLYKYVDSRGSDKASFVLKAWLFSPFTIVLSGIWGMFDAIPLLFVVFALTARPGAYRGMWGGLATLAKSIPLIFTIPLSFGPKPIRNLAIALGIPIGASLLIVWLFGWNFTIVGGTLQSEVAKGGSTLSVWEIAYYLNYVGAVSDSAVKVFKTAGFIWIPAVAIATLLAYKWFGFDTERGVVQSLLLITLTFLLLRGEVNEQYALYLFGLALIDVAMWSPQRRNLFLVSVAAVMAFNVTNDFLWIRYLSPIVPNALTIESNIIAPIASARVTLLFSEAMAFWAVNIYYFFSLYRERHVRTEDYLLAPLGS